MINLTADSVAELFSAAVTLAKNGERVSPRGMATREVMNVSVTLTRPRARLLYAPPARILNPAFAVAETVWILSGTDDPWIFDYNSQLKQYTDDGVLRGAYGPRLRAWAGGIDQLRRVVDILRADPDSRRAIVQVFDPARDAAGHSDVPCTLGFRFHLRHGRLHMSTTMRSQDVWVGMPYDLFCFTTIHELVAGWLDVRPGMYRHHVDSFHIYESDIERAEELTEPAASPEMPKLTAPWDGFGILLDHVRAGRTTGHPGWDAMAATLSSYQTWKRGDHRRARAIAGALEGPLGDALTAWYTELDRRKACRAVPAGTR
ncbi:thymidylate synthase [Streptomyces sp. TS71-3]|uniref:thymidylate synthase n=1 Tax=Streptomyces sp. TS71-3 TaxID=2733862 RepID=UPI001B244829|nr:thymidylate synthase [Streptomyces sp. TS71-3]GHJ35419.1 hypothetical protein Sm713_10280 [Streptomyces sp. TS71-3]